VLVVAAAVSACGGASSGSPPATTAAGGTAAASFVKFTTCLQQHGVKQPPGPGSGAGGGGGQPSPGGGGRGASTADQKTLQAARTACARYLPVGAGNGRLGGGRNNAAFAAYRNCLKLHGVTLAPGTRPSSASTKTKAAIAACAALRPARGGGVQPSTTSTS
jgi:hypothetical protein